MTATEVERCECGNPLDEYAQDGECEWCYGLVPRPEGDWPEGVRFEDLDPEWYDHFTSRAWDWPPTCCGRVARLRSTMATWGECVTCGTMIG